MYGITPEVFQEMYDSQDGKCAICDSAIAWETDNRNSLHVDHDHSTGWVRGLLCGRCNLAIGQFEDDPDLLTKAIEYLIAGATPPEFVFTKVPNPRRVPSEVQKSATRAHAIGNTYRKGKTPWNRGRQFSPEQRNRMREAALKRCERTRKLKGTPASDVCSEKE